MIAVVTGGRNGNLGPIITDELRKIGYQVFILDLPEYDVTSKISIMKFQRTLPGVPTVVVNNAAIDNPPTGTGGFWANMDEILRVNLLGAAMVSEVFIEPMIEHGGGLIINIGSILGNVAADSRNYDGGFRKPVAYGLSKAALIQLPKNITADFGKHNLRSVTMAFGPVDTGKFVEPFKSKILANIPLGRFISEKSVRASIRYAVDCPELTGTQVLCDGGYTCR